jgi:hypothetical protein
MIAKWQSVGFAHGKWSDHVNNQSIDQSNIIIIYNELHCLYL